MSASVLLSALGLLQKVFVDSDKASRERRQDGARYLRATADMVDRLTNCAAALKLQVEQDNGDYQALAVILVGLNDACSELRVCIQEADPKHPAVKVLANAYGAISKIPAVVVTIHRHFDELGRYKKLSLAPNDRNGQWESFGELYSELIGAQKSLGEATAGLRARALLLETGTAGGI